MQVMRFVKMLSVQMADQLRTAVLRSIKEMEAFWMQVGPGLRWPFLTSHFCRMIVVFFMFWCDGSLWGLTLDKDLSARAIWPPETPPYP